MFHLLHRLYLWWIRYGEGRVISRTVTVIGSGATLGALAFHQYALTSQEDAANRASIAFAWIFGIVTVLVALRAALQWKAWPWRKSHPAGRLDLTYLPPEPDEQSAYRFHLVDSIEQLKPYVDESEYFLGEANPDLSRAARTALYQRWFRCNKYSFVYLTKSDRACPVALSIILPLTKRGYDSLHGVKLPLKKVIDFDWEEIAERGPYRYLLVDTFIVSKRQERLNVRKPVANRRYGRTLILRHLALFWKDQDSKRPPDGAPCPNPIAIVAETDKQRLIGDLGDIGFAEKGRSGIGCSLYEFVYPPATPNADRDALIRKLVENIWTVRGWRLNMRVRPR